MPLDQTKIADLLPDNTTGQISPQDLRDSFAEVANTYDAEIAALVSEIAALEARVAALENP